MEVFRRRDYGRHRWTAELGERICGAWTTDGSGTLQERQDPLRATHLRIEHPCDKIDVAMQRGLPAAASSELVIIRMPGSCRACDASDVRAAPIAFRS